MQIEGDSLFFILKWCSKSAMSNRNCWM